MKSSLAILGILGVLTASTPAAAAPPARITLSDVTHTLDRNTLVVAGVIENHGPAVSGLVVDAVGYSAQGDEASTSSDGIPWTVAAGGVERFLVVLVVRDRLIRDYVVRVAYARPPYAAISSVRRGVDLTLYRALILSRVQVRADLLEGWLFVRSQANGLPVARLDAEATLLLPGRKFVTLHTVTLTVPADGTATFFIGVADAVLVSIRVTEVFLQTNWSD